VSRRHFILFGRHFRAHDCDSVTKGTGKGLTSDVKRRRKGLPSLASAKANIDWRVHDSGIVDSCEVWVVSACSLLVKAAVREGRGQRRWFDRAGEWYWWKRQWERQSEFDTGRGGLWYLYKFFVDAALVFACSGPEGNRTIRGVVDAGLVLEMT
jgi:hypothetical protein